MPEALSALSSYFGESVAVLVEAWNQITDQNLRSKSPLINRLPTLANEYRQTFATCISMSDSDVSQYLSVILVKLQIHDARLKELHKNFCENSSMLITTHNIESYLLGLAELKALINKIYGFARGLEEFDGSKLVLEDYRNAYGNLNIYPEEFGGLKEFTERCVQRSLSETISDVSHLRS